MRWRKQTCGPTKIRLSAWVSRKALKTLEESASKQIPFPLTCTAFAIPLFSINSEPPSEWHLAYRLWGTCLLEAEAPVQSLLWFCVLMTCQSDSLRQQKSMDLGILHLRFSAGFRVFTKISWKMCRIFQHIKISLLGNEISVLPLVLGDRLESENGCV